ncbi:hypothetical protein B0H44_005394 [Clostridium beijerinckii]|nr:hypothetical protein [Clostridium beijerinckii]
MKRTDIIILFVIICHKVLEVQDDLLEDLESGIEKAI